MIRIASVALPKSRMNLAQGDEVPQIITRRTRKRPPEFLTPPAKRILQHNRGVTGHDKAAKAAIDRISSSANSLQLCCTHLTRHDFPPWPSYIPQRSPTERLSILSWQNPIIFYVGPNLERVKILPTVCGSCVPPAC